MSVTACKKKIKQKEHDSVFDKENKIYAMSCMIQQPILNSNYNKHMGGVDLSDNFVVMYRIKGKEIVVSNFI